MKILTYNVSWKSMIGSPGWKFCDNNSDVNNKKYYLKCVKNVAKVIDVNSQYDFVTLQEASNYLKIIDNSKYLQEMFYYVHKSGPETMVTFWDGNKYELNSVEAGEFAKGRPYLILTFNNNLTIINIHVEHQSYKLLIYKLEKLMKDLMWKYSQDHRFIISGDFNNRLDPILKLNGMIFYNNFPDIKTCCEPNSKSSFDHTIDSYSPIIDVFVPEVNKLASDHLPVITTLVENNQTGGGDMYYDKYVKYKIMYLQTKNNL